MNFFLPYDRASIPKSAHLINAITFGFSSLAALAFFGTLIYQMNEWPRGFFGAALLLAVSVAVAWHVTPRAPAPARERLRWYALISNLCLLIAFVALGFFLLVHQPTAWIGSIFQIIPRKIFALWGVLALTSFFLLMRHELARINQLLFGLTIFGFASLVFARGFGFDIFVHDATVRAWMSAGFIAPRSLLYNGFYSIIAAAAALTHLSAFQLIAWSTPLAGAALILFCTTWSEQHKTRAPLFLLLTFFATFPALFSTSTPQAFGFLLLFLLITILWVRASTTPVQLILLAAGIATIHPLAGIPAAVCVALFLIREKLPRTAHHWLIPLCLFGLAALPATLIYLTSSGARIAAVSSTTVWALLFSWHPAFQANALTQLAYAWQACMPLAIFAITLAAVISKKISAQGKLFASLSGAALLSALALSTIVIPAIISYEQTDFASRMIIVAVLCALPAVTEFIEAMRAPRVGAVILIILSVSSWYTAQMPWNSVVHTKAIEVTATDFQMVQAIDAHAAGKPYVVLADQVTSAAALHEFGFLDRQLPAGHPFYFYPIPTGDTLYTKYFLPQMYNGITRAQLLDAAQAAGVHDIFFVIKPYWQADDATVQSLKSNTTDWWTVGGAIIGHLST